MKIYGIMLAANEGDIIEEALAYHRKLNIFERIFFFDQGSSDDTFQKALNFKDILGDLYKNEEPFSDPMKFKKILSFSDFFQKGDWLAVVDADEFYCDNPKEIIDYAEKEGSNMIYSEQMQFYLTSEDIQNYVWNMTDTPIFERYKYYLINWAELRFFKYEGIFPGEGDFEYVSFESPRKCSKSFLNRHYQYRSPEQIQLRIKTRLANRREGGSKWGQIPSPHWEDYIMDPSLLNKLEGSVSRQVPENFRNKIKPQFPAYTENTINWLEQKKLL